MMPPRDRRIVKMGKKKKVDHEGHEEHEERK
jgi:hypothetical protein